MGRKHLRMGIYIHARACGLLQQLFQILKVVARDENAGILPHADVNRRDFRITVGAGIGCVKKSHALHAVLAGFQGERHQLVGGKTVIQGFCQRFLKKSIDLFAVLLQNAGMLHVGGQSLQAVGNQFPEAADVFIFCGHHPHLAGSRLGGVFIFCAVPERSVRQPAFIFKLPQQLLFHCKSFSDSLRNRFIVKVYICNSGKEIRSHQMINLLLYFLSLFSQSGRHAGKSFCNVEQKILHGGRFRAFPADPRHCASGSPGCFLTLIAKHSVFHSIFLLGFCGFILP